MVPTTLGCECPSAVTAMPPVKSRYSLRSLSHTRAPSPRTSTTGARLAVVIRCLSAHSISVFVSVMSSGLSCRYRATSLKYVRLAYGCVSQDNFSTDTFFGQHLEQDRVGDAAVDDVGLLRPAGEGPQRGLDLGEHAPVDH